MPFDLRVLALATRIGQELKTLRPGGLARLRQDYWLGASRSIIGGGTRYCALGEGSSSLDVKWSAPFLARRGAENIHTLPGQLLTIPVPANGDKVYSAWYVDFANNGAINTTDQADVRQAIGAGATIFLSHNEVLYWAPGLDANGYPSDVKADGKYVVFKAGMPNRQDGTGPVYKTTMNIPVHWIEVARRGATRAEGVLWCTGETQKPGTVAADGAASLARVEALEASTAPYAAAVSDPVVFRAYRSAALALPNNGYVSMRWDVVSFDLGAGPGTGYNPNNGLWTAPRAGKYRVIQRGGFPVGSANGLYQVTCNVSGPSYPGGAQTLTYASAPSSSAQPTTVDTEVVVHLAAGDQIEAFMYQSTGAARNAEVGVAAPTDISIELIQPVLLNGVGAPVAVRAGRANTQNIPNAAVTSIVMDTVALDTDGLYDPGTGAVTIKRAGIYRADLAGAYVADSQAGVRDLYISVNGAERAASRKPAGSQNPDSVSSVSVLLSLAVGDVVRFNTYQSSGAVRQILAGAQWTWFNVELVQATVAADASLALTNAVYRRNSDMVMGGGTKSVATGGAGVNVAWSARFIGIGMGRGAAPLHGNGYWQAPFPATGTVIPKVNGAAQTVGGGVITLAVWDSLYYVPDATGTNGTFAIVNYNPADHQVPPHWIWLATYNGDNSSVYWCTGEATVAGTRSDLTDTGWVAVTMKSGYKSYDPSFLPEVRRVGSQVQLRGLWVQTSTNQVAAGQHNWGSVGADFRPTRPHYYSPANSGLSSGADPGGWFVVNTNGDLITYHPQGPLSWSSLVASFLRD